MIKKYWLPVILLIVFETVAITYWLAMVLEFLPYKTPQHPRKSIGWVRYIRPITISQYCLAYNFDIVFTPPPMLR